MNKDLYLVLSKHLSGRSSEKEEAMVKDWLSESESNQVYYEEIKSLWEKTIFTEHFSNREAVFDKILDGIQVEEHEPLKHAGKANPKYGKISLVAAAALILLSVSFSFFLYRNTEKEDEKIIVQAKWIEKSNPAGQKSKIYLPDGTIAFLNAESSIRYISDFTDSAREIYLKGEAFFDVKKDTLRPFKVICDEFNVTALGTKFNVNSFFNEPSSTVALVEGKVSIKSNEQYEILKPGESLLINNEIKQMVRLKTDQGALIGWKDGILTFEGDNLREMIKKLERWYGVSIKVSGKPDKNMKYNGIFENEYLTNVLESMRYGREFDFTIDGKNVELNF